MPTDAYETTYSIKYQTLKWRCCKSNVALIRCIRSYLEFEMKMHGNDDVYFGCYQKWYSI